MGKFSRSRTVMTLARSRALRARVDNPNADTGVPSVA